MNKQTKWGVTVISVIAGFMLAVQFQTMRSPKLKDNRDAWELRSSILDEQQKQSKILAETTRLEHQLENYDVKQNTGKEQALKQTLAELKREAGLTETAGGGILIRISPLKEAELLGEDFHSISPDLLRRLINELNMYGADSISINGQRVINNTVIRDINGEPKIDGYSLKNYPIEIKADAEDAQSLYDRMKVSEIIEQFFVDNLNVEISSPIKNLVIPAYKNKLEIDGMEPSEQDEKGDS
ncbi:DUF881 domain-containing protein [Peribacillus kribbensis]|uniref:DUF881 domain-containing protein n=1 Tax=Peribacillus kribbensis TaxID=356658 RepID=UPI00047DBB64|nr:DUF881 domain-containing protein [Peribacillus kribbensis]